MDQRPNFGGFGRAQAAPGQTGGQNPWTQGDTTQGSYAGVGYQVPQQSGFGQAVPQQGAYNQAVPQPNPYTQVPQQQQPAQPGAGMWQAGGFPQQNLYSQTPGQAPQQPPQAGQMPGGAWPAQGTAWQNNSGNPWPEAVYNGQPKRRRRMQIDSRVVLTVLACAVMPLLLVVALVVHSGWLTILTAALAVGMLTTLWLSQTFERPTNIMITVLYAAALVVAIILTVNAQAADRRRTNTSGSVPLQVDMSGMSASSRAYYNWVTQGNTSAQTVNASTAADTQNTASQEEDLGTLALQEEHSESAVDASVEVSDRFLTYWQGNLLDSMVNLCSRSWSQSLPSSKTPSQALFEIKANRTMVGYEFVNITGSINDQRRTATYYADMIPPGRTATSRYVLKVDVVQENGQWYVDPRSIVSNAPTPSPTPKVSLATQPPDPPPADMSTVLYYNPDGGKLYHLDPYCSSAKPEYLPFKGHFTYAEINSKEYKNLTPCTQCGAPIRYN